MVVGVALVYTMHLVVVVGTLSVGSDPLGTHTHTGTDIDNDFHSHLYKFVQVEHLGIHWALDIVEQVETQSDFRFDLHKLSKFSTLGQCCIIKRVLLLLLFLLL